MADTAQVAVPIPISPPASEPTVALSRARDFNVAAHGLRGIASIMVLGAHIVGGTARHIYPGNEAYTRLIEHPWYFGTYGVMLFFVISGYVILPSVLKYSPREFALRRFFRIYPLFFVFTVFFIILNARSNAYPNINNVECVIAGLTFTNLFTGTEQLTPNAWSLSFEAVFYALICFVIYSFVMKPRPFLAALSASAALAFLIAYPISIFFIFGVAIRVFRDRLRLPTTALRILEVVLILSVVWAASRDHFEYTLDDLANPLVVAIIFLTAAYFYVAIDPRSLTSMATNNRVGIYLGTISYSLYLTHPYIYFVVRGLFMRYRLFTVNVAQSMMFFAVIVIILSIAASHFVHKALERWPYQWFFRQRIYRSAEPTT
jgi:peptidoglycan/LPS O-acetylase OafA/YrhL